MNIGVPKEVKNHEFRVGLVPGGAKHLIGLGHTVYVEKSAGQGSGIDDSEYSQAGAFLCDTAEEVWSSAELVIKVNEPVEQEFPRIQAGQMLFTYLHLSPLPTLTAVLLAKKASGIAYETVREKDGSLPLLTPMSEVAGKMAVQIGAHFLEMNQKGRGVLIGGVPGVPPAQIVILGAGVVGLNAAKVAAGMGAKVTLIDRSLSKLRLVDDLFGGRVATLASNELVIENAVLKADLLIGAILIPGASTPKLVKREVISAMKKGAVVIDVSVDQGGCIATSRPTTHSDPTYVIDGILHYCVANMPGAVPRTSTFALTNATLPYVAKLAQLGFATTVRTDPAFAEGVNVHQGHVTHASVAESLMLEYRPISSLVN